MWTRPFLVWNRPRQHRSDDLTDQRYSLNFLTEEWVWEDSVLAASPAEATAKAREALEVVVREEQPELACVALVLDGRRIGVWDRVGDQFVWTPEA